MRKIRKGVFVTNSSSMHSLVLLKNSYTPDDKYKSIYLNDDGVWEIWSCDSLTFGRAPFKCLSTFESKARYAIASFCCYNEYADDKFEKIKQVVVNFIPECKGIELPVDRFNDNKTFYGRTDENALGKFLEDEHVSLEEFLTNKKYIVIVDGDEYCIYEDMKKSGIINCDNIAKEYPDSIYN